MKTKSDDLLKQDVDLEEAGFAQHYCLHCAKYFIDLKAMEDHFKTKVHKRRMKALEDEPYTEKEAELAAGHGSFSYKPPKRLMETQPSKEEHSQGKQIKIVEYAKEEFVKMQKEKRKSNQQITNDMSVEMRE